jgi:intein-encoded DNA endonuclease-like protein
MSNNLLEKGMVPRKSLILEWPKELPEHLISHFIRGYLDGDGCISFNNNSKSFMVGFFSSHKFCEQLNNYFIAKLNMKFSSTKKNKITTLKIHGNPKSKKFLDWIYNGSTIYLSRKYAKYQDLNSYLQNLP